MISVWAVLVRTTGFGCQRLSTDSDDDAAIQALHAALDGGVRWLDTADVYAPTANDIGHNERLVARALDSWSGDRGDVVVSTKGGLVRRGKRWEPNGRAKHLRAACEASLAALGVDAIDVYFLHVPDPKVAIETSVRALAALKNDGLVRSIGLSNVTVTQLEAARAVAPIDCVQIELSFAHAAGFEGGVPEHCKAHGIRLVAYRPLGGVKGAKKASKDAVLKRIAKRHGVEPADVAIAWLYDLDERLVAIPGATRVETAARAGRPIALDAEDRAQLDVRFAAGVQLRTPRAKRKPSAEAPGEVVIVMGAPGAGKTTIATDYASRGYERINRDERGGTLAGLIPVLERTLAEGHTKVVLDNTYPSRASRNRVLETAWRAGVPVRCEHVATPIETAQVLAVRRMLDVHGALVDETNVKALAKVAANTFLPRAHFRYRDALETPTTEEGFTEVRTIGVTPSPFGTRRAVIVDADRHLWASRTDARTPVDVDDLVVRPELVGVLRAHAEAGDLIAAVSWRPESTVEITERCAAKLNETIAVELVACHHPAGPPMCWCRRPLPGLGVLLAHRHGLDLARSIYVSDGPVDRTFADRLGLELVLAERLLQSSSSRS